MSDAKKPLVIHVLTGDLESGKWQFDGLTLWGPYEQLDVVKEIEKVSLIEDAKKAGVGARVAWSLVGLTVLGPIGALAGFGEDDKREVRVLCTLTDGRKFLSLMQARVYKQLAALSSS